jgi:hypothetical protein
MLKGVVKDAWLIIGDFNLIYRDNDKSNGCLNHRAMTRFRRTLNCLEVSEKPSGPLLGLIVINY